MIPTPLPEILHREADVATVYGDARDEAGTYLGRLTRERNAARGIDGWQAWHRDGWALEALYPSYHAAAEALVAYERGQA